MGPPDRDEVVHITRGLKTAMEPDEGLTDLQAEVLYAITASMTGHDIDLDQLEPIGPVEFAEGLAGRDLRFRSETVHLMDLGHMLLETPDVAVADRVIAFAAELGLPTDSLEKARALATGSAQLVAADVDRGSYITPLDLSAFTPLRTEDDHVRAWTATTVAPDLAERWRALGELNEDTLGRAVRDRGLRLHGPRQRQPGGLRAPRHGHHLVPHRSPSRRRRLLRGRQGALDQEGMPERLADAFRRGALCTGSIDFLALDYFSMADRPIAEIRRERNITPKPQRAVDAGSRGPFEPGGISDAQVEAGQRLADSEGRAYDAYGAMG